MTDPDPLLDELVSAYVDGDVTAAERARIEADPALVERAATFAAVRAAVRQNVAELPDDERDRLLRQVTGSVLAPNLVSFPAKRLRPARLLGAAAALIAVAFLGGAIALLATNGRGDGGTASTAAEDAGVLSTAEADMSGEPGRSSAPGSLAIGEVAPPADLGDFADVAGLREAIPVVLEQRSSTAPTTSAADGAGPAFDEQELSEEAAKYHALLDCPLLTAPVEPDEDVSRQVFRARLAGDPVVVVVGPDTVTVIGSACTVNSFSR